MKKTKCFILVFILNSVFLILNCSAQYTRLFNFSGIESGSYPKGALFSDSIFLYGMTSSGGTKSCGVIFKIKPDGSDFIKIHDFVGNPDGNEPQGSLISDGTFLYGMTYRGGTNNMGTIFKIKPDGSAYGKILDFSGTANGNSPDANLLFDGTYLYGATIYGGLNNLGILFKIKPDGSDFSKLIDFAGVTNGKYPKGSLVTDGIFLYGSTSEGGASNMGTLFSIKTNGTDYAKLLDFTGQLNGNYPQGTPVHDGTYLYVATKLGGNNFYGTVIKIKTDGTVFLKLREFINIPTGLYPQGSLVSDGTYLYGATLQGGEYNFGIIYKIKTNGTGFAKILDFAGNTNGSLSYGSYIIENNILFGLTSQGGTNDLGTIFKYDIATNIAGNNVEKNLNIYPNPSNNKITISNNGALQKETFVNIFNNQGEHVFSNTFNNQYSMDIDVSSFTNGVYLIKIETDKGFAIKKLVIQ
jgi:uncharacterized repeat protein (TIGR03803 family)